jgi:tetratricopeptide (TPR) repeat protein
VTRRTRVYAVVGAATILAGGAAAATIVLSSSGDGKAATAAPRGRPPLELDLGIRRDREAVAVRRAAGLYVRGRVERARKLFVAHASVAARVGAAMTSWPAGTLEQLGRLAAAHPHSSLVQLNLGLALYWAGRTRAAVAAWQAAKRAAPDTPSAVRADDLLHPRYNRGLPTFVPSFGPPRWLTRLAPEDQLAALARGRSVRARLLYGVALQRLERPRSAERVFASAAAAAPDDPDAQVAAAVGRFDKDRPERAFSRLGPLTRRFPHAATVRFHLGLLLLWLGQVPEGTRQLRLARDDAPGSPLGREAADFLEKLAAAK